MKLELTNRRSIEEYLNKTKNQIIEAKPLANKKTANEMKLYVNEIDHIKKYISSYAKFKDEHCSFLMRVFNTEEPFFEGVQKIYWSLKWFKGGIDVSYMGHTLSLQMQTPPAHWFAK